jgi:hypothetical protein
LVKVVTLAVEAVPLTQETSLLEMVSELAVVVVLVKQVVQVLTEPTQVELVFQILAAVVVLDI